MNDGEKNFFLQSESFHAFFSICFGMNTKDCKGKGEEHISYMHRFDY